VDDVHIGSCVELKLIILQAW